MLGSSLSASAASSDGVLSVASDTEPIGIEKSYGERIPKILASTPVVTVGEMVIFEDASLGYRDQDLIDEQNNRPTSYWFVNDQYETRLNRDQVFLFTPQEPGVYSIGLAKAQPNGWFNETQRKCVEVQLEEVVPDAQWWRDNYKLLKEGVIEERFPWVEDFENWPCTTPSLPLLRSMYPETTATQLIVVEPQRGLQTSFQAGHKLVGTSEHCTVFDSGYGACQFIEDHRHALRWFKITPPANAFDFAEFQDPRTTRDVPVVCTGITTPTPMSCVTFPREPTAEALNVNAPRDFFIDPYFEKLDERVRGPDGRWQYYQEVSVPHLANIPATRMWQLPGETCFEFGQVISCLASDRSGRREFNLYYGHIAEVGEHRGLPLGEDGLRPEVCFAAVNGNIRCLKPGETWNPGEHWQPSVNRVCTYGGSIDQEVHDWCDGKIHAVSAGTITDVWGQTKDGGVCFVAHGHILCETGQEHDRRVEKDKWPEYWHYIECGGPGQAMTVEACVDAGYRRIDEVGPKHQVLFQNYPGPECLHWNPACCEPYSPDACWGWNEHGYYLGDDHFILTAAVNAINGNPLTEPVMDESLGELFLKVYQPKDGVYCYLTTHYNFHCWAIADVDTSGISQKATNLQLVQMAIGGPCKIPTVCSGPTDKMQKAVRGILKLGAHLDGWGADGPTLAELHLISRDLFDLYLPLSFVVPYNDYFHSVDGLIGIQGSPVNFGAVFDPQLSPEYTAMPMPVFNMPLNRGLSIGQLDSASDAESLEACGVTHFNGRWCLDGLDWVAQQQRAAGIPGKNIPAPWQVEWSNGRAYEEWIFLAEATGTVRGGQQHVHVVPSDFYSYFGGALYTPADLGMNFEYQIWKNGKWQPLHEDGTDYHFAHGQMVSRIALRAIVPAMGIIVYSAVEVDQEFNADQAIGLAPPWPFVEGVAMPVEILPLMGSLPEYERGTFKLEYAAGPAGHYGVPTDGYGWQTVIGEMVRHDGEIETRVWDVEFEQQPWTGAYDSPRYESQWYDKVELSPNGACAVSTNRVTGRAHCMSWAEGDQQNIYIPGPIDGAFLRHVDGQFMACKTWQDLLECRFGPALRNNDVGWYDPVYGDIMIGQPENLEGNQAWQLQELLSVEPGERLPCTRTWGDSPLESSCGDLTQELAARNINIPADARVLQVERAALGSDRLCVVLRTNIEDVIECTFGRVSQPWGTIQSVHVNNHQWCWLSYNEVLTCGDQEYTGVIHADLDRGDMCMTQHIEGVKNCNYKRKGRQMFGTEHQSPHVELSVEIVANNTVKVVDKSGTCNVAGEKCSFYANGMELEVDSEGIANIAAGFAIVTLIRDHEDPRQRSLSAREVDVPGDDGVTISQAAEGAGTSGGGGAPGDFYSRISPGTTSEAEPAAESADKPTDEPNDVGQSQGQLPSGGTNSEAEGGGNIGAEGGRSGGDVGGRAHDANELQPGERAKRGVVLVAGSAVAAVAVALWLRSRP